MRKILLILLIISAIPGIKAQNSRFFYEYKFAKDSTRIDSTLTELMYLDVNERGSKFYSRDVFVTDSTIQSQLKRQKGTPHMMISSNNFKGRIRDIVEKYYPDFDMNFYSFVGFDRYIVAEKNNKINWKITPTAEKVNGLRAQKAETTLFGRKWTAWFSTEYPIQDGPYKFHGLPGLIIRIADASGSHVFELKGVKNLTDQEKWISELEKKSASKLIPVDKNKFRKAYTEDRNDPMKAWQSSPGGMVSLQVTDSSGKSVNMKDLKRSKEEQLKKDNNILELSLIKP
ncbi:GLPGLI family protein [Sphingobacterium zeae]|uniref:GLPGLI family protein n=1 Tax=Sphingobacterium zeae TaxID=1776859 RepID=UPI00361E2F0F